MLETFSVGLTDTISVKLVCVVRVTFCIAVIQQQHALFNGPLSGAARVSRYQKDKTNLDFTEARDSEWQWHQLGHMQVCSLPQTHNHASTPALSFYRTYALHVA